MLWIRPLVHSAARGCIGNARCLLNSAALNASASTMPPTRDARASPRVIQAASNNKLNMAYCAKYLS